MNDYGFIYTTYNLVDGKSYIWKRKYDAAGRWVDYLGSGVLLSRAIQKYGKENFRKEIIDIATSNEELPEKENIGLDTMTRHKVGTFIMLLPAVTAEMLEPDIQMSNLSFPRESA